MRAPEAAGLGTWMHLRCEMYLNRLDVLDGSPEFRMCSRCNGARQLYVGTPITFHLDSVLPQSFRSGEVQGVMTEVVRSRSFGASLV